MTKKERLQSERKIGAGEWMIPVSRLAPAGVNLPAASPVGPPMPAASGPAPSGPPPMPLPVGGNMDILSSAIMSFNANPYIIGLFMLLLNLGGRFLSLELTKKQEEFLQHKFLRPLLFFTVIFIATRNLVAAFWVTVFFFFVIWVVANENSPFCMIPSWCGHDTNGDKQKYESNVGKLASAK